MLGWARRTLGSDANQGPTENTPVKRFSNLSRAINSIRRRMSTGEREHAVQLLNHFCAVLFVKVREDFCI